MVPKPLPRSPPRVYESRLLTHLLFLCFSSLMRRFFERMGTVRPPTSCNRFLYSFYLPTTYHPTTNKHSTVYEPIQVHDFSSTSPSLTSVSSFLYRIYHFWGPRYSKFWFLFLNRNLSSFLLEGHSVLSYVPPTDGFTHTSLRHKDSRREVTEPLHDPFL